MLLVVCVVAAPLNQEDNRGFIGNLVTAVVDPIVDAVVTTLELAQQGLMSLCKCRECRKIQ